MSLSPLVISCSSFRDSKGASVKSRNEKSFFPTSLKITEESKKKDKFALIHCFLFHIILFPFSCRLFGKPKETPFKKLYVFFVLICVTLSCLSLFGTPKVIPSFSEEDK